MKPKGKSSVKQAVKEAYPDLGFVFTLRQLHEAVKRITGRPYVYMDSSRRKLFELREEKEIFFKCISKSRSFYQKQEL